jgi:hypothetical protein
MVVICDYKKYQKEFFVKIRRIIKAIYSWRLVVRKWISQKFSDFESPSQPKKQSENNDLNDPAD